MPNNERRTCFVIAPIGEKDSETRKRSDKVLAHVFVPALSDEYEVTRADKISQPGMITSQILQALQDSDLVIADLSEHNPNVFYELAVRHAVEKPIIHVTDPKWKIPFDVAGFRTIEFDFTDLDSVASAIEQIKEQVREIHAGNSGETPIKLANIMRRTKEDSPQMLLLKQVVEGVANISTRLASLERSRSPLSQIQLTDLTHLSDLDAAKYARLLSTQFPNWDPTKTAGAPTTNTAKNPTRRRRRTRSTNPGPPDAEP